MSESALLRDVINWDTDQCRKAANEVLPQLLLLLQETDNVDSALDCLHVLCNSFLACLPTEPVERKFMMTVVQKISDIFESCLDNISHILEDNNPDSQHIELIVMSLKVIHQIFTNMLSCLRFLNNKATVMLESIYTLPVNVINLLRKVYFHIKESETIYAEYMEMLAEPLRNIVKLANTIQMQFLKLMENVTPCLTVEKDVQVIIDCCDALAHLAQIAYSLDFKIVVIIWKTYTRLVIQWKTPIIDRLDVAEALKFLCKKTVEETEVLISLTSDPEEFSEVVRMCNFNLKIIISVCEEFCNYLGDCVTELTCFILDLYRLYPHFLHNVMTQNQCEEIQRSIVVGIEPLVSALLKDQQFLYHITTNNADVLLDGAEFSYCMLNMFILKKLPTLSADLQSNWIKSSNSKKSIISIAFTSIEKCYADMRLPVFFPEVVSYGNPQKVISFYDYVRVHICSFVSTVTTEHFPVMEKIIFDLTLSSSGMFAILINDIWCFISRYGTAELCYSHCCLLADIIKGDDAERRADNIRHLLGRMMKFMAPKHMMAFQEKYPVLENIHLWSFLPLNALLTEESAKNQVLCQCFEKLHQSYEETMTKAKYQKLCDLLDLTSNVIHEIGCVSQDQIQIILNWFQILNVDSIIASTAAVHILGKLITVVMHSLPFLQEHQLLQVLEYLFQLQNIQSDYIETAIILFLKQWKSKYVSPSTKQSQILFKLSRLFNNALRSSSPVLRYEVLCAYTMFALTTTHAAIISNCIGENEQLQNCVQKFITNEMPDLDQNDILLILKKQHKNLLEGNLPELKSKDTASSIKDNNEDTTIRTFNIAEIHNILDVLDNNMKNLQNIQQQQKFPEDVVRRLRTLYSDLGQLC